MARVVGYGLAKAAVENATRWLAVELTRIRRRAACERNRARLLRGRAEPRAAAARRWTLTPRGRAIIDHTPAGRFGAPDELVSTLVWLCGPGARFVNGVVVPVDGGFSAFSGV